MQTSRKDTILWILYAVTAIAFILTIIPFHPYPGSFLLKAMPVTILFILVLRNYAQKGRYALMAGLIFSVAGDIILDIDRNRLFIAGLVSFLLAHVFYILAMKPFISWFPSRWPVLAGLAVFAGIIFTFLADLPAGRLIPVTLYLVVICSMSAVALMLKDKYIVVFAGSVLFVISDTIIAVNKFIHEIPHSTVYNISIYFIAQGVIVAGMIQRSRSRSG